MSVQFLPSNAENILWDKLSGYFNQAEFLRVSSAFLSAEADLVAWLAANPTRRAEVLVRLEFPTYHKSVETLRRHPRVVIHAADCGKSAFHEKLFIAYGPSRNALGAYIGSANWTVAGIRSNVEAGVWITSPEVLNEMSGHFVSNFKNSIQITDKMLEDLKADFIWHSSNGRRPEKDRGTLISSWENLRESDKGLYLVKQNGISAEPFLEGDDDFCDYARNQSSQTINGIPSTFKKGLGVILTSIARRTNGAPDRLIYGRGQLAGYNPKRWSLPKAYLKSLIQRDIPAEQIERISHWPDIFWVDPVEYVNYPPGCNDYIWLSDYMDNPSFQGGYRWLTKDVWEKCNLVLDAYTDKLGLLPVDRQGIWWNDYLGITDPQDQLYMTKSRIENFNLAK